MLIRAQPVPKIIKMSTMAKRICNTTLQIGKPQDKEYGYKFINFVR